MISSGELLAGLYGAWRLARGDTGGMQYFNASPEGFWRSFTAALLVAPLFAIFLIVRYQGAALPASPPRFAAIEAISYTIAWFVFPLIMFYVVQVIERERHFFRYIVAYNWASVWQNFVYLPLALVGEFGLIPVNTASFMNMTVLILVFLYTWFVTRTALAITGMAAAAIVAVDFMVSVVLNLITEGLLRAGA